MHLACIKWRQLVLILGSSPFFLLSMRGGTRLLKSLPLGGMVRVRDDKIIFIAEKWNTTHNTKYRYHHLGPYSSVKRPAIGLFTDKSFPTIIQTQNILLVYTDVHPQSQYLFVCSYLRQILRLPTTTCARTEEEEGMPRMRRLF